MKTKVKQACKYVLAITAGVGLAQIWGFKKINLKDKLDATSQSFRDYLKDNNLTYPKFYDNYLNIVRKDHFLEKLILKESGGLDHYKIFFPHVFMDQLFEDKSQLSMEEKIKNCKMTCIFSANSTVQSHVGIVHGGFQAALIDNLYGYLGTLSNDITPCATATLNINYKKPVRCNEEYIVKMEVTKIEGRKVYISAKIEDQQGNVHTESTALMISVNWQANSLKKVFQTFHQSSKIGEPTSKLDLLLNQNEDIFHPEYIFRKQHLKLRRPVSSLFDEMN